MWVGSQDQDGRIMAVRRVTGSDLRAGLHGRTNGRVKGSILKAGKNVEVFRYVFRIRIRG